MGSQARSELASNIVLVIGYALLGVYALRSRFGNTHPKTHMIRWLCNLLVIGCLFRILYFG
jgi:hypothetical protein